MVNVLSSGPAQAETLATELRVIIDNNLEGLPSSLAGNIETDVSSMGPVLCFYLPYNDPQYSTRGDTSSKRYELTPQRFAGIGSKGGSSTVLDLAGGKLKQLRPYLFSVQREAAAKRLSLQFKSTVPRLPQSNDDDWYFDGFYPMLLESCPTDLDNSRYFTLVPQQLFSVKIQHSQPWTLAAPGELIRKGEYQINGRDYVFGLGKGLRTTSLNVGDTHVELFFRNPDFLQLLPTIQQSMLSHYQWFGPLATKRVVVIETSDLQRSGRPGIIAFNRPKQSLFKSVEAQWLNWRHWVIANLLASQWYGATIGTASPDDEWLLTGIADFATLEALELLSLRSNFFNSYESGQQFLVFTYPQMQSLSAAMLMRSAPLATLTDETFKSRPYINQSPLVFVRHALAMRALKGVAGQKSFSTFLRGFSQRSQGRNIGPRDFLSDIASEQSPFDSKGKALLAENLKAWWSAEGWPDLKLIRFDKQVDSDGRWKAEFQVAQAGELRMPVLATLTDKKGHIYFSKIEQPDKLGQWIGVVQTENEPLSIEIDPNREVFDADRFNNSSLPSKVVFFPGGAKTLEDDAYTLFWLPYPFRRPGEAVSLGVTASLFRYLHSSLNLRLEGSPSDKRGGYLIRREYRVPSSALAGSLSSTQNYEGHRVFEASVDRNPVWRFPIPFSLGVRARHRQIVGRPDSPHVTASIAADSGTGNWLNPCKILLAVEDEYAPKDLASSGFSYNRSTGVLAGECQFSGGAAVTSRAFSGQLIGEDPPDLAFFLPQDLKEARIRMDLKGLPRFDKISSNSNDLYLPLVIPFPGDSLILSRQIKFRSFYDFGRSANTQTDFRAAGIGLDVPFGGDLAAVGSFSLTRLSLLSVLYSQAGEEVSRAPRILFDLSGEL